MNDNIPNTPALTNRDVIDSAAFDYKGWRERFIAVALRLACLIGWVPILASFGTSTTADKILFLGLYLILIAVTFLRTPYWLRAGVLLSISYLIGMNAMLAWGVWVDTTLFFLAFVVMAGLLYDQRVDLYALALCAFSILAVAITTSTGYLKLSAANVPVITPADWAIFLIDFLALAIVLIATIHLFKHEFTRVTEHMRITFNELLLERSQLEERVGLRTQELELKTAHLRASTSIARLSVQIDDTAELMNTVAALTAERFSLNHVGIFLLDERKRIAFLQAASSQTGKDLIARGYRVELDRRSAITSVVEQGRYQFISENAETKPGTDVDFPFTRSRLIIPLNARGAVIGAMDLHSEQAQMFGPEDAEVLQSLADLIAISIENVRLLNESRALVSQLETLTSYQSQDAWRKFSSQRTPAYQYTPSGVRPVYASSNRQDDGELEIPLSLRGQKLGVITLRRKENTATWTERERNLLEKIAAQIALALDNSRLVEEAQRNAQRDQLIASVSNRVRETLDVDAVVRTAAAELKRIFDLKEAEVSLGTLTPTSSLANPTDGRPARRGKSN